MKNLEKATEIARRQSENPPLYTSPNVNAFTGRLIDPIAEADRVIVRNRMRKLAREVEAAAAEAHDEYLAGCGLCK